MPWPDEHLGPSEHVQLVERRHPKTLIGPGIVLVVIIVAAIIAAVFAGTQPWGGPADLAILIVAVLLILTLTVRPWLTWVTTRFAVTTSRITSRTGILARSGEDIPIRRIVSVNAHQGITDRMFGCGTLVMESASEVPLQFDDIPHVQHVHNVIYQAINDQELPR
jgi:membrane protein YdbS with pleckstrin-like domain